MSLLIQDRDYVAEGDSVAAVSGGAGLINEILFRLTVRRGSFPLLPDLGSRLYLLRTEKSSGWQSLARQYAAEALEKMPDLTVVQARVTTEGERLWVAVDMNWQGELLTVECEA